MAPVVSIAKYPASRFEESADDKLANSQVEDAILDAKRLASGMSFKNAMAGLPFGGGKSVLCRPDGVFDRQAIFIAFGKAVESLGGTYITAEDVGTSVSDMEFVRAATSHVFGLTAAIGRAGGDPSPWTALGVYNSMRAAATWSGSQLSRMSVAIQGVGHVGQALAELLAKEGAYLIIADIDTAATAALAQRFGAHVVPVEQIHRCQVDIFAPCALGAVLNETSIVELQAPMVIGAANNQLATEEDGQKLFHRGILYAPDYVVNAGGVINIAAEYLGESRKSVAERVAHIGERLVAVLDRAKVDGISTNLAADRMATEILEHRTPTMGG